jgi:uncharacterized phiE125 gp8 family phage protein
MADTYQGYQVTTANADLPITMEMVRTHLRLDDITSEDVVIQSYVQAAASYIEKMYGVALLTQTIKEYHAGFPTDDNIGINLRISPVISITSVKYIDDNGTEQTWSNTLYATGIVRQTAFVIPKHNQSWPKSQSLPNSVVIEYQAGFGDGPAFIPQTIKQAILLMVGDMDQNREDNVVRLPRASEMLLAGWFKFSA